MVNVYSDIPLYIVNQKYYTQLRPHKITVVILFNNIWTKNLFPIINQSKDRAVSYNPNIQGHSRLHILKF